ncbi:MAG: hypothetical protein M1828_000503 [Chrysothrix sp. TS-e1954]|nr:MAG: hypothetical protein M1828_000503 [Chrysothrix sp. TS-e1954]
MPLSPKSLAGPGYIILNVLRAMNIIGLLAVIAASMVMLVKTVTTSNFFFFDGVSHAVTVIIAMLLVISETKYFRGYIARCWPLLSPSHGFVTLGSAMLILGVDILGNLNKPATSQKHMGLGFWRIVIASGILITILGFLNIIASFVFRDRKAGVTARQVRAKGAVAISSAQSESQYGGKAYSFDAGRSGSGSHGNTPPATYAAATPIESSRRNDKRKSSRFTRFGNILPLHRNNGPPSPTSLYSVSERPERRGMQISAPVNINPNFEHPVRPDIAHHPASRVGQAS